MEAGGRTPGTAKPELLHTYSSERQQFAQELIDFDREFARMFSAPPKETSDIEGEGIVPWSSIVTSSSRAGSPRASPPGTPHR